MVGSPASIIAARRAIVELIPDGERVLAAVSGGADSLALLRLLRESGRNVVVAHIDHGLRGEHSAADATFVAALCQSLGVANVTRRVEVLCQPQTSLEMAARQVRYATLLDIARDKGCSRVATGHTASDQLETVLLHWLRGAAVSGMGGMRPARALDGEILLVRPLLEITREDAEALCREASWAWREDASNFDPRFARNRVRQELIPLLANLMNGPDARVRLARQTRDAAAIWRDDIDALDSWALDELQALTIRREESLCILDGLAFGLLPRAMQRRVLRVAAMSLSEAEIGLSKIEMTRRCIAENGRRAVWQWTRNLSVEWTGAGSGNRIRFRVVRPIPDGALNSPDARPPLL